MKIDRHKIKRNFLKNKNSSEHTKKIFRRSVYHLLADLPAAGKKISPEEGIACLPLGRFGQIPSLLLTS